MKTDKLLHFLAGAVIAFAFGIIFSPEWGLASAMFIGTAKELIWDKVLRKGTQEVMDAVATIAGGFLGYLIMIIFL